MNIKQRNIDICFTPAMINLFNLSNKQVVIIDVFRATSAMCVFLNNGGDKVIPVLTIEEAKKYQKTKMKLSKDLDNYLVAAERNGDIVDGFDLGNSPLLYADKDFSGSSLIITTTNGTKAIEKSKKAGNGVILASFLNSHAIINHIINHGQGDVLIVCSGWKGRSCIEDILLAGMLTNQLLLNNTFLSSSDSVLLAITLYNKVKFNIFDFLSQSSYRKRMNIDQDIEYCLQKDTMNIVPIGVVNNQSGEIYFKIYNNELCQ